MSKNSIISVVVIVVLILLGWFILGGKQVSAPAPEEINQEIVTIPSTSTSTSAVTTGQTITITSTDSGFSPSLVTIKVGDTVIFKNEGTSNFWPASAMHPTHTVYPSSDVKKCGTSAEDGIFDACKGYAPGTSWSFTFTQVGSWAYHNHLNPKQFGKISVE